MSDENDKRMTEEESPSNSLSDEEEGDFPPSEPATPSLSILAESEEEVLTEEREIGNEDFEYAIFSQTAFIIFGAILLVTLLITWQQQEMVIVYSATLWVEGLSLLYLFYLSVRFLGREGHPVTLEDGRSRNSNINSRWNKNSITIVFVSWFVTTWLPVVNGVCGTYVVKEDILSSQNVAYRTALSYSSFSFLGILIMVFIERLDIIFHDIFMMYFLLRSLETSEIPIAKSGSREFMFGCAFVSFVCFIASFIAKRNVREVMKWFHSGLTGVLVCHIIFMCHISPLSSDLNLNFPVFVIFSLLLVNGMLMPSSLSIIFSVFMLLGSFMGFFDARWVFPIEENLSALISSYVTLYIFSLSFSLVFCSFSTQSPSLLRIRRQLRVTLTCE